jgi:hypothetical protein
MTPDQIRETLHRVAAMRMPRLERDHGLNQQIESLQEYLVETAIARADLEEAHLYAYNAQNLLIDQWDALAGWEIHLPEKNGHTKAAREEAKALLEPDLAEGLRDAKRLLQCLARQIVRLEMDERVASRTYTLLTGG